MDEQSPNQEDIKRELEQIKAEYAKAKNLLVNIQNLSKLFDELKNKSDSASNEVLLNAENIRPKRQEIEEIKNEAQNRLNEITTNLDKVKGNILSMQDSYTQFSEIKGKIEGRSGEIENLLQSATGLKNDIENTKNESLKVLENIRNSFAEIQKKVQEMQSVYEEFLQIKGKIDDDNTGLKAAFDSIQNFKAKAETIYKEIQSYRDESSLLLENIRKNNDETESLKNKINGNLKESQESKEELNKIVNLITDTGFANAFQERAKKLFFGYCVWGGVLIVSVLLLIVLLIVFFYDKQGTIPELNYVIFRLTLTSPLLFLIGFSVAQYSKERDLNEKYEFKAVTATVIRNHIKFLIENYQIDNDGINSFSAGIFSKIYTEPFEENGKMEKKINDLEKAIKKETKQNALDYNKIISNIKELKTLIPDEKTLKDILNLLINK